MIAVLLAGMHADDAVGLVMALLLCAYFLYALIKPEKF